MNDRNWDAELAKIDKQLSSISDEQLVAEKRAAATAAAGAAAVPATARSAALPAGASVPPAAAKPAGAWRGWVQTIVAVGAAVGLYFWPWPANCGLPLYGLVAASGVTSLLGVWSAIGSWKHRLAPAHVLSLAVIVWSMLLGAREVLPRVGYAVPDAVRGAGWDCGMPAAP